MFVLLLSHLIMLPPKDLSIVTQSIYDTVAGMKARGADRRALSLKVCEMIFFELNDKPSAGKVHSFITQGSMTDIGKDVDLFWQSLRMDRKEAKGIDGVPEAVSLGHADMLQNLWRIAMSQAQSSFDEERRQFEARSTDLAEQLLVATNQSSELLLRTHVLSEEVQALQAECQRMSSDLAVSRQEIASLEKQLTDAHHSEELQRVKFESEIVNLKDQRARDLDGLTRDLRDAKLRLDSERQQHIATRERGDKEVLQSNQILQSTRQQLNLYREQQEALSEKRENTIQQLNLEIKDLKSQISDKPVHKPSVTYRSRRNDIPRRQLRRTKQS